LSQEQGWFKANNALEFASKVQPYLEQVEMGIGEKFGQCIIVFFFIYDFLEINFGLALHCSLHYCCCFILS
jgi:hypothetical protein